MERRKEDEFEVGYDTTIGVVYHLPRAQAERSHMHSALPDMGQLRGLGMKAVLKCGQHIVFDLPADVLHR